MTWRFLLLFEYYPLNSILLTCQISAIQLSMNFMIKSPEGILEFLKRQTENGHGLNRRISVDHPQKYISSQGRNPLQ